MLRRSSWTTLAVLLGGCFTEPMIEGPSTAGETSTDSSAATAAGTDGSDSKGDTLTSISAGSTGETGDGSTGDPTSVSTGDSGETTTGAQSSTGFVEGSTGQEETTDASSGDSTGETALTVDDLDPGDLIITEVMWNPTCSFDNCEWIEIYNTTDHGIDLFGLRIDDNSPGQVGVVGVHVVLSAQSFGFLAFSSDAWPYDEFPDAFYGSMRLNNGEFERVVLLNETTTLDETPLFFVPDIGEGVSSALSNDAFDHVSNDDESSWCTSTTELLAGGSIELGTPRAPNDC